MLARRQRHHVCFDATGPQCRFQRIHVQARDRLVGQHEDTLALQQRQQAHTQFGQGTMTDNNVIAARAKVHADNVRG